MNFKDYYNRAIIIFRALPLSASDIFRKDDYVTKSERFALEHAETSSIYNGEDYKIIKGIVYQDDIKPADNPGEYIMVNEKPGKPIWKIVLNNETQTVDRKRFN